MISIYHVSLGLVTLISIFHVSLCHSRVVHSLSYKFLSAVLLIATTESNSVMTSDLLLTCYKNTGKIQP
jgi:hypothetical protein